VDDPEIGKANPCEAKYNTLTNARSTLDDPNLRPNSDEIAMLNEILRYPPTRHLKQSEKDIIWKFRVYLSRNKRALTKFLKSVEWTQSAQAKVACGQLLPKWERPDVKDALELLSSTFAKCVEAK
jgi:phosphatidylinositol 3-kinase